MRALPVLALSALAVQAYAANVSIVGTKQIQIPIHSSTRAASAPKTISLMNVTLSPQAVSSIQKRIELIKTKRFQANPNNFPSKADAGMNNVPVLDQGSHGTCVTFAVTAAIDAVTDSGDYISQSCSLQLGNYLQKNGYQLSGWEGNFAPAVLSQMDKFGIMTKADEASLGCAGLTTYPVNSNENIDKEMPLESFHQYSKPLTNLDNTNGIYWSQLYDINNINLHRVENPSILLNNVKDALVFNSRVVFGTVLPSLDIAPAGAAGKHTNANDSWVLSADIIRDLALQRGFTAGHEMVIIGYDDDAEAVDNYGVKHKGLLTLRNSWGEEAGDKGNYYMSYDYFSALVIEANRIDPLAMVTTDDNNYKK